MRRRQENRKNIASDDDMPVEKWLVSCRNPASKKHLDASVFIRQFYAADYYEAYDTVLTYAENMNMEVIWFREKRSCESLLNQCPADMKAARQSFAQESVWHTILQCAINLGIGQRVFSLLSHEHLSIKQNQFYFNNSGL